MSCCVLPSSSVNTEEKNALNDSAITSLFVTIAPFIHILRKHFFLGEKCCQNFAEDESKKFSKVML